MIDFRYMFTIFYGFRTSAIEVGAEVHEATLAEVAEEEEFEAAQIVHIVHTLDTIHTIRA